MKKFFKVFMIVLCVLLCLGGTALLFSNNGSDTNKTPTKTTIKLASWNIGHFAGGSYWKSTITDTEYKDKLSQYRNYVYTELNADIIGLCEYSGNFISTDTNTISASSVLFNAYGHKYIGGQSNYSCNAIYSKRAISSFKKCDFDCNQSATITHTDLIKATDYYYIESNLMIDGKLVKIVMCHLAFDNNLNPDTLNKNQFTELVNKYKDCDRVVIMGDFNAHNFNHFDIFKNNGYSLANNDSTQITFYPPSFSGNCALDNFVYKGVSLTDFEIHQTTLSDHYAITCNVSI